MLRPRRPVTYACAIGTWLLTGCEKTERPVPADRPPPAAEAQAPATARDKPADEVIHTCPMHPEIQRKQPENCPICGMKLVPKEDEK